MKKGIWFFLSLAILGLFEVNAQQIYVAPAPKLDIPNLIWNSHMMRQMGTNATGQAILAEQLKRNASKKNVGSSASTAKTIAPNYRKEFAFNSNGNFLLSQKIVEAQGANKSSLNVDQMNSMIGFLWNQYQLSFQDEHQRLKMPYNDLATAMTYYVIYNYLVTRNLTSLESEKSVAVYNQLSEIFLKNTDFAKVTNSEKQMLAEVFVTVGGMSHLIYKTQNDAAKAREMAQTNLTRIFGQNADKLKITENGIEF